MSDQSIQILHRERIPTSGVVVIPSRLNLAELVELARVFVGRKITWLVEEQSILDGAMVEQMQKTGSGAMFSVKDQGYGEVGEAMLGYLEDGGVLVYVPGKVKARRGTLVQVPSGELKAVCGMGLPVLPIAVDRPKETAFKIEKHLKMPGSVLVIGEPIAKGQASISEWQKAVYLGGEESYRKRPMMDASLGMYLLEGLKKYGRQCRVKDGSDDSELSYGKVLAAALAFSEYVKKETEQDRVAIVLPPGKAGLIANLAVVFAGKTPVNLNFTAGAEAIRSSMRQAEVDRVITADAFVRKVSSFPWPPNRDLIFIERVLPELKGKIKKWAVLSMVLPAVVLGKWLGVDRRRGKDEAVLLFTSGSSGEPKGVVLSHRNVLANVNQFVSRLQLHSGASILGCLPLFHSFGSTVTLWFPMIEGIDLVTYPSPVESKRLAELVSLHQVTVLLSTPTFLRGYMKRVEPSLLQSLKLVVTGAEKLAVSFADAFQEKFGIRPQEGYGLTETSPAANVNLTNLVAEAGEPVIASSRNGSVGQLLPGMAVRLTDPGNDQEVPLQQQGMIWLKGANVFGGYLGQADKTAEVLQDGWFRTGDVGRMDEDGFLFIEGRLSRFSKIGGEMVPHETVEAAVVKVLRLDGETERRIAVVGVPDEQKGEAIVLLSTVAGQALEQECIDLRYKLLDEGLPSLWCPKQILPVSHIPVLASGKLDIKGCESLVVKLLGR